MQIKFKIILKILFKEAKKDAREKHVHTRAGLAT